MKTISYTNLRNTLATVLDEVTDKAEEIVVTRSNKKEAIMISLEEYNSIKETAYLLSSPKNAQRLSESIADIKNGLFQDHDLIHN